MAWSLARAEECPFTSMLKKRAAEPQTVIEVPFKELPSPSDSAIPDGVDVDLADATNSEALKHMLVARWQKGRIVLQVGDLAEQTEDVVDTGKSRYAQEMATQMIALKESRELTFLKRGDSQAGVGSGTPMKTRGATGWIQNAAHGDSVINAAARTPVGNLLLSKATASTVTEADITAMLQSIATVARAPQKLTGFVSPNMQNVFDGFALTGVQSTTSLPLRRFETEMPNKTIEVGIKFYKSSHGEIALMTHYSLPATEHGFFANMPYFEEHVVRAIRHKPLEDKGGGPRGFLDYISALVCTNPQRHGRISTSAT